MEDPLKSTIDQVNKKYVQRYLRDGTQYRITVEQDTEGRFWGRWYCSVCDVEGRSSKGCSSVEGAVFFGKTNISTHHIINHGSSGDI